MSVLKQLEDTKITPEEIQELILLLDDVIPKVEAKSKSNKAVMALGDNLREKVKDIQVNDIVKNDYVKELESLKSVREKLKKAIDVIRDF